MSDTIYALSSGQGRAGVAVVRLSGAAVADVFRKLCGKVPRERMATLVDRASSRGRGDHRQGFGPLLFRASQLHRRGHGGIPLHGGRAVVMRLLDALSRIGGLRPAEAGEFTRRAFVNGKLDLVEVEGLGDVVSAETEGQLKLAQRLARGALSETCRRLARRAPVRDVARRGAIDFSDEADVTTDARARWRPRVKAVLAEDRGCFGRRRARRAASRRGGRGNRRAAECRKIDIVQPPRAKRERRSSHPSRGRRGTRSRCISSSAVCPLP